MAKTQYVFTQNLDQPILLDGLKQAFGPAVDDTYTWNATTGQYENATSTALPLDVYNGFSVNSAGNNVRSILYDGGSLTLQNGDPFYALVRQSGSAYPVQISVDIYDKTGTVINTVTGDISSFGQYDTARFFHVIPFQTTATSWQLLVLGMYNGTNANDKVASFAVQNDWSGGTDSFSVIDIGALNHNQIQILSDIEVDASAPMFSFIGVDKTVPGPVLVRVKYNATTPAWETSIFTLTVNNNVAGFTLDTSALVANSSYWWNYAKLINDYYHTSTATLADVNNAGTYTIYRYTGSDTSVIRTQSDMQLARVNAYVTNESGGTAAADVVDGYQYANVVQAYDTGKAFLNDGTSPAIPIHTDGGGTDSDIYSMQYHHIKSINWTAKTAVELVQAGWERPSWITYASRGDAVYTQMWMEYNVDLTTGTRTLQTIDRREGSRDNTDLSFHWIKDQDTTNGQFKVVGLTVDMTLLTKNQITPNHVNGVTDFFMDISTLSTKANHSIYLWPATWTVNSGSNVVDFMAVVEPIPSIFGSCLINPASDAPDNRRQHVHPSKYGSYRQNDAYLTSTTGIYNVMYDRDTNGNLQYIAFWLRQGSSNFRVWTLLRGEAVTGTVANWLTTWDYSPSYYAQAQPFRDTNMLPAFYNPLLYHSGWGYYAQGSNNYNSDVTCNTNLLLKESSLITTYYPSNPQYVMKFDGTQYKLQVETDYPLRDFYIGIPWDNNKYSGSYWQNNTRYSFPEPVMDKLSVSQRSLQIFENTAFNATYEDEITINTTEGIHTYSYVYVVSDIRDNYVIGLLKSKTQTS